MKLKEITCSEIVIGSIDLIPSTGKRISMICDYNGSISALVCDLFPSARQYYIDYPGNIPRQINDIDFYDCLNRDITSGLSSLCPLSSETVNKIIDVIKCFAEGDNCTYYINDGLPIDCSNAEAQLESLFIWRNNKSVVVLYIWADV